MPNKLTDAEVKKALPKVLYGGHGCKNCKYDNGKGDDRCGLKGCKIARYALDLINRQEQKHKELWEERNRIYESFKETSEELEEYRKAYVNQQAENESLKAEVERLKKVEERHMRLYYLLLDPVIVANGKNGELRPIKRTSRQDVYHTLLRAQEIMKIPHRWFPWKRDGDNK